MIFAVWAFAGVISFFGALACAELGAAFPATGGQYVFLREACRQHDAELPLF
jgi:APA family basic amino acid/polyamine antiporter